MVLNQTLQPLFQQIYVYWSNFWNKQTHKSHCVGYLYSVMLFGVVSRGNVRKSIETGHMMD